LDLVTNQRVEATVRTMLVPKYGVKMRPYLQDGAVARSRALVSGDVIGATPGPRLE